MDLTCEERPSESPYVERVWRSYGTDTVPFISLADTGWSMVVACFHGKRIITVRGPETRASSAVGPADFEFFGIHFRPGTLIPKLPPSMVMDRCDVNLPGASEGRFWLQGESWEYPTYDNADVFVDWLLREDVIQVDPVVSAVLEGQPTDVSLRTAQRRFVNATGMTHGTMLQIRRARKAIHLLTQGMPILDVVEAAGYYDQPHLHRAMKQFAGLTPAQLLDSTRTTRLSFLYKNEV